MESNRRNRIRTLNPDVYDNQEDDGSDEVINKRFAEYNEKTLPLIDFYKKSRKLIKIDAGLGMDGVLKSIIKKLDLKKPKKKSDEKI